MMREMAVFCDETGTHDCDYFGWGSVWCPLERAEEMDAAINRICGSRSRRREIKWSNSGRVRVKRRLMNWFFRQPWVCFQSLMVRKDAMRVFSENPYDAVGYRKLLCTLLCTQMERFDRLPGGPRRFTVFVDETGKTTRSLTAEEFRILQAAARKRTGLGREFVRRFRRIDSRDRRGIQVADLFIGAIRAAWDDNPTGSKASVCRMLADQLGWRDLQGTTRPNLKFNVWLHRACRADVGHLETRRLRLKRPRGNPERVFDGVKGCT